MTPTPLVTPSRRAELPMPWVGEESDVLAAWIAARARTMVRLWPLSARTGLRVDLFSQQVAYPSAAHARLYVTITLRRQSHMDGESAGDCFADVTDSSLEEVGELLRVRRLSPAFGVPARIVTGRLYGSHNRVFAPLVVSTAERAVNVLFLIDTGSQITCLRVDTWKALVPEGSPVPGQFSSSVQ